MFILKYADIIINTNCYNLLYHMVSLRQRVIEAVSNCSTLTNDQLYELFPKGNKTSIRVYANEVRSKLASDIEPVITNTTGVRKSGSKVNSSTSTDLATPDPFIDDPDELLYSVAIRELNKAQPDPRWANILLTCREKIQKSKIERLSQLHNKPVGKLLTLLERKSGKPSVSDSSPTESMYEP